MRSETPDAARHPQRVPGEAEAGDVGRGVRARSTIARDASRLSAVIDRRRLGEARGRTAGRRARR